MIKVIILEDEVISARSLENRLNKMGYQVLATMATGEEAVLKADGLKPDLILADIRLRGEMDGIQAAQFIQTQLDIPVIYLTAHAEEDTLLRARLTGPYGYLLKPVDVNELRITIEMALYKHNMEKQLRESEDRYRSLFETNQAAMLLIDPETACIVNANAAACHYYGYKQDEILNKPVTEIDLNPPEEIFKIFNQPQENKERHHFQRHRMANGEIRHVELYIGPIFTSGRRLFYAIIHDINDRVKAETALRQSERQFREVLEEIELIATILDRQGNILFANDYFLELTGYQRDDIMNKNWFDTFIPENAAVVNIFRQAMREGRLPANHYENAILTRRGEQRMIVWSNTILRDIDGNMIGVSSIGDDVTEHRQHSALQEAIITISTALRGAETRQEMIPLILDIASTIVNLDGAGLAILDPANRDFVLEHTIGKGSLQLGQRIPYPQTDDHTNLKPEVINADKTKPRSKGAAPGPNSEARIPLIASDEPLGLLIGEKSTSFTKTDLRILDSIAEIAANAIQRVTLHDQTQRSLRRLQSLHTIDKAISTSFEFEITAAIFLEQLLNQLQVDAACIWLIETSIQTIEYAAGKGFRQHLPDQQQLHIGEGFAGKVALTRSPLIVPDISQITDTEERASLSWKTEKFSTYHGLPLTAKGQVKGVLELYFRSPFKPDADWLNFLDTMAGQAAIAIENNNLLVSLHRSNLELTLAYDTTLEGWAKALDLRDHETEGHSRRVTDITLLLAIEAGIKQDDLPHIRRGALLHDIGKMGIPDQILNKPGPLTTEEWEIMRKHPLLAYELLSGIPYLQQAIDIPYCHHEKWDGSGYPRGLAGEKIPLPARIFAVVDVWDALSHPRPYRPAWEQRKIISYIREQAGIHFDPKLIEPFLNILHTQDIT